MYMYVPNVIFWGKPNIGSHFLHGAQILAKYQIKLQLDLNQHHILCESSETDVGQKQYSSPKVISSGISWCKMVTNDK